MRVSLMETREQQKSASNLPRDLAADAYFRARYPLQNDTHRSALAAGGSDTARRARVRIQRPGGARMCAACVALQPAAARELHMRAVAAGIDTCGPHERCRAVLLVQTHSYEL